jgi:hypothetical protein
LIGENVGVQLIAPVTWLEYWRNQLRPYTSVQLQKWYNQSVRHIRLCRLARYPTITGLTEKGYYFS